MIISTRSDEKGEEIDKTVLKQILVKGSKERGNVRTYNIRRARYRRGTIISLIHSCENVENNGERRHGERA